MAACEPWIPDVEGESLNGKVLVIVRTSSPARVAVVEQLWQLGVKIVMIHPFYNKIFFHYTASWINCETDDVESMYEQILDTLQKPPFNREDGVPDGVMTLDDYAVYPCALLAKKFKQRPLPLDNKDLKTTMDKELFRDHCLAHDIAAPLFAVVHRGECASQKVKEHKHGMDYPIVMKCSSGAGKMQTKLCRNAKELDEHADVMWDYIDTKIPEGVKKAILAHGEQMKILLEEFIGGDEVDIDCVVHNGEVLFAPVSDNFATEPPFFAEQGGLIPSQLPEDAQLSLVNLLKDWVKSYGTKVSGVLHFEAKYDPTRPRRSYIIEVNTRLGGAESFMMVRAAYGVELGECMARLALGMHPFRTGKQPQLCPKTKLLPIPSRHCASVNILPPAGGGVLSEVRLPREGEKGLVCAQCINMGIRVYGPPRDFACVVWLVASGETGTEAQENLKNLSKQVLIKCIP